MKKCVGERGSAEAGVAAEREARPLRGPQESVGQLRRRHHGQPRGARADPGAGENIGIIYPHSPF